MMRLLGWRSFVSSLVACVSHLMISLIFRPLQEMYLQYFQFDTGGYYLYASLTNSFNGINSEDNLLTLFDFIVSIRTNYKQVQQIEVNTSSLFLWNCSTLNR